MLGINILKMVAYYVGGALGYHVVLQFLKHPKNQKSSPETR